MTFLLIDTSQPQARVVLARDSQILAERAWESDRGLGVRLLHDITGVLREAQLTLGELDRIAVCKGPGSFSAVRTGVVTATMLAYAKNVLLVAVGAQQIEEMLEETVRTQPVEVVKPLYKMSRHAL